MIKKALTLFTSIKYKGIFFLTNDVMNKNKSNYFALYRDITQQLFSNFSIMEPNNELSEDWTSIKEIMFELSEKLIENYPYFHPNYVGQMIKPPHLVAQMAYQLAMWINPNNHALDGGIASSKMEKQIIREMIQFVGWQKGIGHLTGGGTMANLEALWIAGQIEPDKALVGSTACHYTHKRISAVLQLKYIELDTDFQDKIDLNAVETLAKQNKIGTLIVNMGTTGTAAVDPLKQILNLKNKYGFRIHADAAYGGYFKLAKKLKKITKENLEALTFVDSIVIDPHKHGLQPYGCGCVLFQDEKVGNYYKHDSPYTYFSSEELHLGEISLECSRPGAAAVALWATMRYFPLVKDGDFAKRLDCSLMAAQKLYAFISQSNDFFAITEPELDIINFSIKDTCTSKMSLKNKILFEKLEKQGIYTALNNVLVKNINPKLLKNIRIDSDKITILRMCLMKPEHLDIVENIWSKVICTAKKC